MRVVLDTGILIAALITRDTPPDRIYQAWRKQRFELVTSKNERVGSPRITSGIFYSVHFRGFRGH